MKPFKQLKKQASVAEQAARRARDEETVEDLTHLAAAFRSQAKALERVDRKKKPPHR